MEKFWIQPRLYYGAGAMDALKELGDRRVLIVTDAFLAGSGLLDRVRERLAGPSEVFDRVEPDPSLTLVALGVQALEKSRAEAVVAFGGGSPMDCAKGIRWAAGSEVPLWCIPTTAGTGSEMTSFAVLTDTDKGVKCPIVSDSLLPQAAILDPALLAGVPPKVTADTGMDVLAHAAEALVAAGAGPFSDALAEKAFTLAWKALPLAWQGDEGARGEMLYASCLAGMAFNAAGLGLCHGLSHALGGRFHLAHGRLNAMLLPAVVKFNAEDRRAAGRYARLAELCGLTANPRSLAGALKRLARRLGIEEGGPDPAKLKEELPRITTAALEDRCTASNPRKVAAEDIEGLLEQVWSRK